MYWVIRWTNRAGEDQSIVVEAKSKVVAETIALKRDIPVVIIEEATDADVAAAREAKLLWRSTPQIAVRTCFGRPVAARQLACLMCCGLWTIGLLLQTGGVLPAFVLPI